jgi:ABC-type bacteriocin/lantibiotic exporter with double-glycine peptidase domain
MLKPDSLEIRNIYVYSISKGLLSLSLPLGIQSLINFIQGGKISTSWVLLVFLVILSVLINGLFQIFQLRITENLQQKIFTRAAFDFAYRIPRVKFDKLLNKYPPELMNRFFDTVSIQKGLTKILIDFSTAILHIFFSLVLLSLYHYFFIFFSFLLILLSYFAFKQTFNRGLTTTLEESSNKYELVDWLQELARNVITFKLNTSSNFPLNKTDTMIGKYLQSREIHFKVLLWQYSFMVFFKVLIAFGMLVIGGLLVMEGKMNIGQFVASEIVLILLINAFEKVILSLDNIYDVLTSVEKIGEVIDMELDDNSGEVFLESFKGDGFSIELENLRFKYPHQNNYILKDISFRVKSGDKIMITGPNGSGKSTLLNILAGLYEKTDGKILFNDIPLSNFSSESIKKVIGEYLNNQKLFNGTIYENIVIGRSIEKDSLNWILENLGLIDYIKSLDDGLETKIGPSGITIQGSNIQKLILARVLITKPKLLLLEDPLDNLDREDRKKVLNFLTDRSNGWTLVAISNDKYLARQCDQVFIIENGKINNSSNSI